MQQLVLVYMNGCLNSFLNISTFGGVSRANIEFYHDRVSIELIYRVRQQARFFWHQVAISLEPLYQYNPANVSMVVSNSNHSLIYMI